MGADAAQARSTPSATQVERGGAYTAAQPGSTPVRPGSTAEEPGPSAARTGQVLRTFIVEDSDIILDNLVAALEEMAPVHVVGSAPDEGVAMARLQQLQGDVDLVIIDVFLKSGSGLGVLRAAARAGLRAKRVVLTNYATPDMRAKCEELGADRVFDKSNDLDELLLYCTRLAEGRDTTPGALN